jgi:hypothetical protein
LDTRTAIAADTKSTSVGIVVDFSQSLDQPPCTS